MPVETEIQEILLKYWGHSRFRPLQSEIIQSVLEGHDTLALLPTGGGKSVCFQVPALYRDGICVVISPLIALMKDQVENLRKKNRSEEHTSELQSRENLVCRLLLEKKNKIKTTNT